MMLKIQSIPLRNEYDIVVARKVARDLASAIGFDKQDQARVVTGVSELARNVVQHAMKGQLTFMLEDTPVPGVLAVEVVDEGPGIPDPDAAMEGLSREGQPKMGLLSARRVLDSVEIDSNEGRGALVLARKRLRRPIPQLFNQQFIQTLREASKISASDPLTELQHQNQDLADALEELEARNRELAELNRELEETNRGVVALYAELDERAEALRKISEVKTRFLSNVTHEFRTPVNGILSIAQMLQARMDGDLTEEQERQVRLIRQSAATLNEMVDELLDLAKIESGRASVHLSNVHPQEVIKGIKGIMRHLIKDQVTLAFDVPEDLPVLLTDESKLTQILRNLVSNALKYTHRGEVKVSVGLVGSSQIRFVVQDTGIGIAPEHFEVVFEEFGQVEGDHQRGVRGTGLGLPLAKRLAELLGGYIDIDSEIGIGSTFTLTIPMVCPTTDSSSADFHYSNGSQTGLNLAR